jgi:hypothetical protein
MDETPAQRLRSLNSTLYECVERLELEGEFEERLIQMIPDWSNCEELKFRDKAILAFQKEASLKFMSPETVLAEITWLALSRASDDKKAYKELEQFFDEVWDGSVSTVQTCLVKAVKKYNSRFTEARQRVK